ncbi:unnamed protein product [Schistosoma turkestanicum]|nr:unnamed protein product [Schistosoma turkestanicum]
MKYLYFQCLINLLFIWKYVKCINYDFQRYPFPIDDDNLQNELIEQNNFLIGFDESWPSINVNDYLGVVSSIKATDQSASNVYVLHRGDRVWDKNTFDQENNYRLNKSKPIEKGVLVQIFNGEIANTYFPFKFFLPHGLTIDPNGNFWITDLALHQVFKFSLNLSNEPLLTLGERFKPGSGENQFCKPTDVVVSSNGLVFISDGYCNNRIMKFNENGKFLKSWGYETKDSKSPGPNELNLPHQLTLLEEEDAICVADRENKRIVCYTAGLYSTTLQNTGEYLFEYNQPEMRSIYGVAIESSRKLMFALVGSTPDEDNSKVEIIDFNSQDLIGEIRNEGKTGFGDVHSIATCPSYGRNRKSCVLFCNTNLPSQLKSINNTVNNKNISNYENYPNQEQLERHLWLYHLQFNSEYNYY